MTSSAPVNLPVWLLAMLLPCAVRPIFTHTIGTAARGGVVGGERERAPVLEPLDVGGDHAGVGQVGEVPGEVGELEVDLVAGRRPVVEADAELLGLEDRAPLVARLADQRDLPAGQVGAERLERVEVGVRSEEVEIAGLDQRGEPGLGRDPVGALLGEPGAEDDGERGTPRRSPRAARGSASATRITARSTLPSMPSKDGYEVRPSTVGLVGLTGITSAPTSSPHATSRFQIPVLGRPGVSPAPTTATRRGWKKRSRSRLRSANGRPVTSSGIVSGRGVIARRPAITSCRRSPPGRDVRRCRPDPTLRRW